LGALAGSEASILTRGKSVEQASPEAFLKGLPGLRRLTEAVHMLRRFFIVANYGTRSGCG